MTCSSWRFAHASIIGTSHLHHNLPCQDASDARVLRTLEGDDIFVAVVSDGAGSAPRSRDGANIACQLIMDDVDEWLRGGANIRGITEDFARGWLIKFRQRIHDVAEKNNSQVRDYACTLLTAVVGSDCGVFFQVGDGVIVVSDQDEPDQYQWQFWPQQGEYANTTFFATDELAGDRLEYIMDERSLVKVALMSDGLQPLALHYQSKTAHPPFFIPMYRELMKSSLGHSGRISGALEHFLNSRSINERVDDDKTLVLAMRDLNGSCTELAS